MQPNEYADFCEVWIAAYQLFDKTPAETSMQLAFAALSDYSREDISKALTAHIKDPDAGRFAPKVADVIRQIEGSAEEQAIHAFHTAVKAIAQVGPYESVLFKDQAIGATIDSMGGWVYFCQLTDDDLKFKAVEFSRYYKAHKKNKTMSPRMLGITETTNKDHKKYQEWLANGKTKSETVSIGKMVPDTGLLETDVGDENLLGSDNEQKKIKKK